jgi:hypothetical protein
MLARDSKVPLLPLGNVFAGLGDVDGGNLIADDSGDDCVARRRRRSFAGVAVTTRPAIPIAHTRHKKD